MSYFSLTLCASYCKKEGIDFKQLLPLINETTHRLQEVSPAQAQTGPAIRHDAATINKHLELLKNHPQLQKIYQLLSESIESGS